MAGPFVRRNVFELGDDWADEVLWYARGTRAMQQRPLTDPTSWRFYGAIHGVNGPRWRDLGYLSVGEAVPATAVQQTYFAQCQHGSWYFLPWHRGYLLAFEEVLRDAIVGLGGPADWALPYWNYFRTGQSALPPAFASPDWPDGTGDNPLFVSQRWGPNNDGNVVVDVNQVDLLALNAGAFTGSSAGGSPGFGGPPTGFSHGSNRHGRLESQPHDMVHVLIGGASPEDPTLDGVMSDPDTAGLDPIFWLHHTNIDRLWQTWRTTPAGVHTDPVAQAWLAGPQLNGQRRFVMPLPAGKTLEYRPEEMVDLVALGYSYDDLSPEDAPAPGPGSEAPRPRSDVEVPEVTDDDAELVGASEGPLVVSGTAAHASVRLDAQVRTRVSDSLAGAAADAPPDEVFLNLENIRGLVDSTGFAVYVGPPGADPANDARRLAGNVGLFGVRKASELDGAHAGQGLTIVLDITRIVDDLHLADGFDLDDLQVSLVPNTPVPEAAQISIGRIAIYRQGAGGR